MLSQDIRRKFLAYFKGQGHRILPSSPVVPHDDPTLLFINAGMNQFKDVFLGKSKRDYKRAATTQKCIRVGGKHNDLENVGHTSRHLTFFEMIGNFSFGDYFKKEAIAFAWDVTRDVFSFDPSRIWVSVYKDDEEAFALWEKHLPASRIVRFGEKENFWAMGDTGPCGPCSELLFDRGAKYGSAKNPYEDTTGERYLEFWNLVFMQFMRDASGKMDKLPQQSIDTGAGLERVVSLSMGVDTVYATDILRGLIRKVEEISHTKYEEKSDLSPSFHVIADHIRSLSFAIADGAQPSNTDRGYVLRKILRRAVRYGRKLGMQRPFLADVLPHLVESMGDDFPEIKTAQNRIAEILTLEEEAFLRTLQRGGNLLNQVIQSSKASSRISGEDAFKLKDTYGLPLEEVTLIAKDEGLAVDIEHFQKLEEEAKKRSKKAHKTTAQEFDVNLFKGQKSSEFVGYRHPFCEAKILSLLVEGQFVDEIKEGQEGVILLDKTPFYAEMGGQVGDRGLFEKGSARFLVEDTTTPYPGVIAHTGKVEQGSLRKGEQIRAHIDEKRRREIQNNHTATHLLHFALNEVLGAHIRQAGSLVEESRFRFDFNHHKALSATELRQIEDEVNAQIRSDETVHEEELSYDEAQKRSDIKQFFGEKYGEKVRVIGVGKSKELCGGTHTTRSGTIGFFKIIKESSIAAGVRRIEAVTGRYAEERVHALEEEVHQMAALLKTPVHALLARIQALLEQETLLIQELKIARKGQLKQLAQDCFLQKEHVGSIDLISSLVTVPAEDLAPLADELMGRLKSGVIALGTSTREKCQLLIQVSADLPLEARSLIKEIAPLIQGGGGGTKTLAQAGGKDSAALPRALAALRLLLEKS